MFSKIKAWLSDLITNTIHPFYVYGSFTNHSVVSLVGLFCWNEKHMERKLRRLEWYGWEYDSAYIPLKTVASLPEYVKFVF